MDTISLEKNINTIIKTGTGYGTEFLPALRKTKSILKRINRGRATAENYYQLGNLCLKLEDSSMALEAFLKGYQLNHHHVNCGTYAALLLEQQDRVYEAIDIYKQLNSIDPDNIEIVKRMLLVFYHKKYIREVLKLCYYFLEKKLYYPTIYEYISLIYEKCGNFEKALEHITNAIVLDKSNTSYIDKQIYFFIKTKDFDSVIKYKDYIDASDLIVLKIFYANSLAENDRLSESRKYFAHLLKLKKDTYQVLAEIALLHLNYEKNIEKSKFINNYILKREPSNIFALSNLALVSEGDWAISAYEKVIEQSPDHPLLRMNYGHRLLQTGSLKKGFEYYESRVELSLQYLAGRLSYPQDIKNKRILIWNEQGIGDLISWSWSFQFLEKEQINAKIQIDKRLLPIMKRSFPSLEFSVENTFDMAYTENFNQYDAEMINASVAKYFVKEIEEAQFLYETEYIIKPHLYASRDKIRHWTKALSNHKYPKTVGICWRSGLSGGLRDFGYLKVEDIVTIFQSINCQVVNLQYSYTESELEILQTGLGDKFVHFHEINLKDDQDELAGLISSVDIVFSVTTAVLSLAGALGVLTLSPSSVFSFGKQYNIFTPSAKTIEAECSNNIRDDLDHYQTTIKQELDKLK